ncbi:MAG: ribonuclease J [Candidatus Wildermuthbacteria bacterium]|nr:ribonuclease J [Candidatus Wildermuthbacteria bacterium]
MERTAVKKAEAPAVKQPGLPATALRSEASGSKTLVKAGLRIIPLGGLGEVGRNMMVIEYGKDILIVDMGLRMPEEDMPGIDYIIPNTEYLRGKERNIVGILITHGHYDHIGALPYLVGRIGNPPVFAAPLAKGIIMKRQEDVPNQPKMNILEIQDGKKFHLGPFEIEPFRQNHNIPDNFGFIIGTPLGNLVHTSDFKFDDSPVNDPPTDYKKLKAIGERGVLLLMSDSTNAEEPNHSLSEKVIMENLDEIIKNATGRVFTATFASLINRLQQIITISEKYGRRVSMEGFSMKTNIEISKQLGYVKAKRGTLLKTKDILGYPDNKITVMCTGAQGEERAVLMRIVNGEHPFLRIQKGDTVVFSSSVIPGNERTVQFLKDQLYRQKANVFHYKMMDIHASGHANQDELSQLIELLKPKFFLPIHGQISMLVNHAKVAQENGIPEKNIAVAENGNIVSLSKTGIIIEKEQVPANYIMVDGLGIGDVGEIVLRDRQSLAKDGMFVVIAVVDRQTGKVKGSPDIISRGFIYLRESKDLLRDVRRRVVDIIHKSTGSTGAVNWVYVRDNVRNKVGDFLFAKTERRPMVLPVIIEV